jgi:molecular chaperone DnaK (HSP70)
MEDWILSIDFGTSFTTAAIREDGRPALVRMTSPEGPRDVMPSSLFLPSKSAQPSLAVGDEVAPQPTDENAAQRLVVGWTAEHQAAVAPDRFEPTPKRRLGMEGHMVLGGEPLAVADAVAKVLAHALDEARRSRGRSEPAMVALTHPASWAQGRVDALVEAARAAGITEPRLLSEPEAAALHFAANRVPIGALVAVYDLGGGTFDAAVLQRTGETEFRTAARPGGQDGLGGEEFDRKLYEYVANELAAEDPEHWADIRDNPRAHRDFRIEVRRAKEALSRSPTHDLYLPAGRGRTSYRVTVDEFDGLIRRDIDTSMEILRRTLAEAGIDDPADSSQLADIYLAGGSSRIPLVAQLIGERLDRVPQTLDEPKTVVALGATSVMHAPARAGGPAVERLEPISDGGSASTSPAEVPAAAKEEPPQLHWLRRSPQEREAERTLLAELGKWNWGACLLGPLWGMAHGVWQSLVWFVPVVGWILLGANGNRWAWEARSWESVESFHDRQTAWAAYACCAYVLLGFGALAALKGS